MNFKPDFILPLLKNILKKQCTILFSAEIITENNSIEQILVSYRTLECKKFAFSPLHNLGFNEKDAKYIVEFRNSRVEIAFTVLSNSRFDNVSIRKGDAVITAISYRYTLRELENLISHYFSSYNIFTSSSRDTVLILARSDFIDKQLSLPNPLKKYEICHTKEV